MLTVWESKLHFWLIWGQMESSDIPVLTIASLEVT